MLSRLSNGVEFNIHFSIPGGMIPLVRTVTYDNNCKRNRISMYVRASYYVRILADVQAWQAVCVQPFNVCVYLHQLYCQASVTEPCDSGG